MPRILAMHRWTVIPLMVAASLASGPTPALPEPPPDPPRAGAILFLDGRFVLVASSAAGPARGSELERAWLDLFHARATIPFRLAGRADIRIDIWDLSGRRVRELVGAGMPPGDHALPWDGRDDAGIALPGGAYFYRMAIDGRAVVGAGKALLLR